MNKRQQVNLMAAFAAVATHPALASDTAVIKLLDQRKCQNCNLSDADLVHADLRDTNLKGSKLVRANLSQANLDGANLSGADLSFTSLLGASLRGTDLRGAKLEGTDFRQADLSGARLDRNALSKSHWKGAIGISTDANTHAAIHNSGVELALAGKFPEAEEQFNQALLKDPSSAATWLARSIVRAEQAKRELAAQDLNYAAMLYEQAGDLPTAQLLYKGKDELEKRATPRSGNGWGPKVFQTLNSLFVQAAPLALKIFAGSL